MTAIERVDPLERLQAYRLAVEAMRDARVDAGLVRSDRVMRDVAGQLMRSAGSIAANIAEGYSRGTGADRRRFLEYALGSTRETLVWYGAFSADAFPAERVDRLISIRRLLLTMIRNSRKDAAADRARFEK
jgi:four helix bundle protein